MSELDPDRSGWLVLSGPDLLDLLRQAADGVHPDLVAAEALAAQMTRRPMLPRDCRCRSCWTVVIAGDPPGNLLDALVSHFISCHAR